MDLNVQGHGVNWAEDEEDYDDGEEANGFIQSRNKVRNISLIDGGGTAVNHRKSKKSAGIMESSVES